MGFILTYSNGPLTFGINPQTGLADDIENDISWTGDHQFNGDIGFFGATPRSRPTVSGSRQTNPALADLLSALEDLGLINDSTTQGECCSAPP